MSASDDSDLLMQLVRARLEKIQFAKGFSTDYNLLTPAVHEHYREILSELVDDYFERAT